LKPVNWCFDCGSALAEAEVEYMTASILRHVGFPCRPGKIADAFGLKGSLRRALDRHLDDDSLDDSANQRQRPSDFSTISSRRTGLLILAADLWRPVSRATLKGRTLAPARREARADRIPHPFYDRIAPVYLAST